MLLLAEAKSQLASSLVVFRHSLSLVVQLQFQLGWNFGRL